MTLDPLELELQMVVSHHVGAGNQTETSARAASALNRADPSLQPDPLHNFLQAFYNTKISLR